MEKRLKTRYNNSRLNIISESANSVLVEKIDRLTMNSVIDTIKKLQGINFSELPTLDQARDRMIEDVVNIAAGEDKPTIVSRIAAALRQDDGVIYDALAFGSAVKNFFAMFKPFVTALATKNGVEPKNDMRIEDIGTMDLNKAIRRFVHRNFVPQGGVFKMFGKNWRNRFFEETFDNVVNDVMLLTFGELDAVIADVQRATKKVDVIAGSNDKATGSDPSSTADRDAKKPSDAWEKVKADLTGIDPAAAKATVDALAAKGLLKL